MTKEERGLASLKYADEHPSDYTNEMYGIVDIEKAFEAGAEWVDKTAWKPADGDYLPDIDREVIALVGLEGFFEIPPDEPLSYKVVFAHRPPEYWDGKNILTGKVTRNYTKRYDKGGWNQPNVKWWLDLDLPKMEE